MKRPSRVARTPLYVLTSYGMRSPWFVWRFARGGFDEWCTTCNGTRIVVRTPCGYREPGAMFREHTPGCPACTVKCPACKATGLRLPDGVHPDDFADGASLRTAAEIFPDLRIEKEPRMHMHR